MPPVMRRVDAQDKARPVQPVNHSHSFRLQIRPFGVDLETVGPGTRIKETTRMMSAGAATALKIRVDVEIFSWV